MFFLTPYPPIGPYTLDSWTSDASIYLFYLFHMVGKDAGVWCSRTLFQLSIDALVQHPHKLTSEDVSSLPESIATQLFEGLFAAGKMNPRLLAIFERTEYDDVLERIQVLGLNRGWVPPLIQDDADHFYKF